MTTLIFVRDVLPAPAAGTRIAVLDPSLAVEARGDAFSVPESLLQDADAIEEAAEAWTKDFGRRAQVDGAPLKGLLRVKGVPLWYFAELYLHHSTDATRHVRVLELFARTLERERPDEVRAAGLAGDEALLLQRLCEAQRIAFKGALPPRVPRPAKAARASRWNNAKTTLSAWKHAAAGGIPARSAAPGRRPVLFLSHAAFWQSDDPANPGTASEHYFGPLIPALRADPQLECVVVAVGPQEAHRKRGLRHRLGDWIRPNRARADYVPVNRFTTRRVARATARASREIRHAWRRLRKDPSLHEAFSHREVRFSDLCAEDLAATMLLQLPWAVRSMEETAEILEWAKPAALVLYAESSGWGRAALAAARAAAVQSVAIQHGILYPHYFSYRHEADEAECPIPDVTAVFGEEAKRLLVTMGRYPPERLVVTGSPKFDALLERARRLKATLIRERFGIDDGDALLTVASRFRPIRDTHQALGSAFARLVRAVESMQGVAALVKPHPAEPDEPYETVLKQLGARHVDVVTARENLGELLVASDALVTVESLAAIEALVVRRPVIVLNMPTNLRALVQSGAALGVNAGEDPRPALEKVLFDSDTRAHLDIARRRYLEEVACGVDGKATERLLELIRKTAISPSVIPS